MDWKIIFDVIQSLAIVTASIVAILGINSWREETKWKGKYEMAFEVLSLFYEAQENIRIIREPASGGNEGKSRIRSEKESKVDSESLDLAYVARERYENHQDPFIKLRTLKPRFRALFGNGSQIPFDDLSKLMSNIFLAAHFLGTRYWKDRPHRIKTPEEFERDIEQMNKFEAIIWRNFKQPDEIEIQVDAIISEIEFFCLPILSKK